jgi:hypothetical protein
MTLPADVEKTGSGLPAKHTTFTTPRSVTIQENATVSPQRELELRRQNSISITSPQQVDAPSRIIGEFR